MNHPQSHVIENSTEFATKDLPATDSYGNLIPSHLREMYDTLHQLGNQINLLENQLKVTHGELLTFRVLTASARDIAQQQHSKIRKYITTAFYVLVGISGVLAILLLMFPWGLIILGIIPFAVLYLMLLSRNRRTLVLSETNLKKMTTIPLVNQINLPWYIIWVVIPLAMAIVGQQIGVALQYSFDDQMYLLTAHVVFMISLSTTASVTEFLMNKNAKAIIAMYAAPQAPYHELVEKTKEFIVKLYALSSEMNKAGIKVRAV